MSKLSFLLFLIAFFCFPSDTFAATRVFYDGSEAGNTNLWDQDDFHNKCSSVTAASDGIAGPYAGSRMIRCNSNGTVAWNAPERFESLRLPSFNMTSEVFYRVRFRADANHDRTSGSAKKILRLYSTGYGSVNDMYSVLRATGGLRNEGLFGGIQMNTYWGDASGDNTANSSSWHMIEWYINKATGVVRVWHDDVLIRNQNFGSIGGHVGEGGEFYIVSNFEDNHDATNYLYFDEFEVYTDATSGTQAAGSMADGTITTIPIISNISGTIKDGNAIVISGTGFGTKSPAAPVMWAPFDSSINLSNLGRITSWTSIGSPTCTVWESNIGVGSGGGIRTNQSCAGQGVMEMYIDTASIFYFNTYSQRFYIYRNRYKSYSNDVNLKSLEINGTNYGDSDLIYNDSSAQWITQGISPGSYFYIAGGSAPNNQWLTEELTVQSSASNGAQPAVFRWCRNGTTCTNVGDSEADNIALRDDANLMHRVSVAYHGDFNCGGSCPNMGPERFDNLYLDNTWARVMIGNTASIEASTHREIQIPTAWNDTSVAITANQGSFTPGQTAYLYVIDANGDANPTGYPVTIGGGGSDIELPVWPTGTILSATAPSSSGITVTWSAATDNVGVTGYIVERCQGPTTCTTFSQVGTPAASPFTDTGLSPNTEYSYHVRARDAAGNLSGWSNVVGATTRTANSIVVDHTNWNWIVSQSQSVSDTIATKKLFFAHASVGANVLSGLESLRGGNATKYPLVTRSDDGTPPASTLLGSVYEYNRGNPDWSVKVSDFTTYINNGWHLPAVDFAMNKFCYIDQNANWTTYRDAMVNLEAAYPSTHFIYWTMPLMTSSDSNEVLRAQFNANLRNWIAGQSGKLLFDIADIEAWNASGVHQTFLYNGTPYERMETSYSSDGGHLNQMGSDRMATGLYSLLGMASLTQPGDTISPVWPTGTILSATAPSSSGITVTWSAATDNVGVTGYIVERCQGPTTCTTFSQVGTPAASPFTDTGLSPNTEYSYHVRARDAAGNLSGWTNVVSARTQTAPPVTELIIDNADANTSQSGSWSPSTNFPGYYGTNYHYSPNQSGEWFEWRATNLTAGTYQVFAYWNANSGRPTDAFYSITHSGGTATVNNVNQTQNGTQWNLLGTYTFGTTGTVRVISGATGTEGTCADAVRFVRVTAPTSCNTVTPANFSQSAYNNYGAPYDLFSSNAPLVDAKCTSADTHTIAATVGKTGDTTRIVYTKGYYFDPGINNWAQYTSTCTGTLNGDWCAGSTTANITTPNISTASKDAPAYFVGMVCSVQGGGWKCGCRDTTCNNFYWMIQGAGM